MTKKYHGPTSMDELATLARNRLANKDWFYCPIFGMPGTFKSSTALQFSKMIQPDFDPVRQVVQKQSEYQSARRILPPRSVIVVDEAIKAGKNRRRALSRENAEMVEDVNTGRKLEHAVIDIMPFEDDFDPKQLKHAHWTCHFTGKGVGTFYEVRRVGFRNIKIWEEARFDFRIRHCADVDPPLWRAYERRVNNEVRGDSSDILEGS